MVCGLVLASVARGVEFGFKEPDYGLNNGYGFNNDYDYGFADRQDYSAPAEDSYATPDTSASYGYPETSYGFKDRSPQSEPQSYLEESTPQSYESEESSPFGLPIEVPFNLVTLALPILIYFMALWYFSDAVTVNVAARENRNKRHVQDDIVYNAIDHGEKMYQ